MGAALEEERVMASLDEELRARQAAVNDLEAYCMDTRAELAREKQEGQAFAATLTPERVESVNALLESTEEWIYDQEDGAGAEIFASRLKAVEEKVRTTLKEYFEARQVAEEAREKELEQLAAEAKAEEEKNGGKADHDQRKLPYSKRLNLVKKNKEEGTDLFKAKNLELAAVRYTRALAHTNKFTDLSEERETEVKGLRLSLRLNLAMIELKRQRWDDALRHATIALEMDSKNVKALYRCAFALEKNKKFKDAKEKLKVASEIAPDDKAVGKLVKRVEAQLARQRAKEKKMAARMFG